MTVAIRLAVSADMGALQEVFRLSALSNSGDRANLSANPECLELSDVSVVEGRTRVAVAEGRIVGFATTLIDRDCMELEDLFVHPECMGQGVGSQLVLDVVAMARDRQVRRIEVTANRQAFAFYQKVGFVYDHDIRTRFAWAPRMHLEVVL